MDDVKKKAYLLLVLGIVLFTIAFFIGVPILDSTITNVSGYNTLSGIQMFLQILYNVLILGGIICIIVGLFMLIKYNDDNKIIKKKELKSNDKAI